MKVNKNLQPVSIPIEPHNRHIEMTPKEALKQIANTTISSRIGDWGIESHHVSDLLSTKEPLQIIEQALTELEELKSRRDELNETIQDLISKAKHWEEKENKTDFEKGIVRGYKTMLNQLLVGIDFDKENKK